MTALQDLSDLLSARFGALIQTQTQRYGQLTLTIAPEHLLPLCEGLKSDALCAFTTLVDITAVDHPTRPARFELVYHFLSMARNHRLRVKCAVEEEQMVPSLTGLFKAADWYEREVFDMFGILFKGHPDLRRLLTDYGFTGHPLRKDFPTTGYVELRYDEAEKRVVYEPVKLVQEYRQFDFLSPWEGMNALLPGDEKSQESQT